MRKTLIFSLLLFLLAGGAGAEQSGWKYDADIDEMTGRPDYGEGVYSHVQIKKTPWVAELKVACSSWMRFVVYDTESYTTTWVKFSGINVYESSNEVRFRIKFDNNEPFYTRFSYKGSGASVMFPKHEGQKKYLKDFVKLLNGMKKHNRIWIQFDTHALIDLDTRFIAKFDLTGFSRELAKCSKIPETN